MDQTQDAAPPRASRDLAVELDAKDPLASFRDRFVADDPALVYFDGNSLGRLPSATQERLATVVAREWGQRLIRSWDEGWMSLPVRVGDRLGRVALGADAGQVVVADSTTVCLYKLVNAALDARPGRDEIVVEANDFPTDRYVVDGVAARHGCTVRQVVADPITGPTPDDIAAAVGSRTAVVLLSHVSYRSSAIADMAAINDVAHRAGALTLWDLSHSVGSIPVALDAAGSDLATGCSYKYLNGGPGAPAFLYVRRDLQTTVRQPIWGWIGHRDPFAMGPRYAPAQDIRGMVSGTPPILGLTGVDIGVGLLEDAGIAAIRTKGMALTDFAIDCYDAGLAPLGFELASPRDATVRGAHISLRHADARRLSAELIDREVIPDFRTPDLIRIGLSPLTTRFTDVWDGLEVLRGLAT